MMKICSPGRLSLAVLALVLVVIVVLLKTQSDQVTDRSGFSQNGFIPDEGKENKCCDAIKGRQLEEICYYDGMTPPASTTTDLPTITHWAWKYTHSNLLKHPRTLEFNPRIHMIGYINVAVDSLVPERVPSSSRTPGYEATLLTV